MGRGDHGGIRQGCRLQASARELRRLPQAVRDLERARPTEVGAGTAHCESRRGPGDAGAPSSRPSRSPCSSGSSRHSRFARARLTLTRSQRRPRGGHDHGAASAQPRRAADDHAGRPQAARLRSTGRAVGDRGMPADRDPGADGLQPSALALRRRHRSGQAPRDRRALPEELGDLPVEPDGGDQSALRRPDPGRGATAGRRLSPVPGRPPRARAGLPRPVLRGAGRRAAVERAGRHVGLDLAGRLELHAGRARPRPRHGLDHACTCDTSARSPRSSASRTSSSPRRRSSRWPTRAARTSSPRTGRRWRASCTGTAGKPSGVPRYAAAVAGR